MKSDRIRRSVEKFILHEPNLFLYIRRDTRKPCMECRSTFYQGSRGWCDTCLGTGYEVRLEKVPVRRIQRGRLLEEAGITPAGYVSEKHVVVYTPAWLAPKDEDLLMEVTEWIGVYPAVVFRAYRIYAAFPNSQSEVSYYSCYGSPYEVDLHRLVETVRTKQIIDFSLYRERSYYGTLR